MRRPSDGSRTPGPPPLASEGRVGGAAGEGSALHSLTQYANVLAGGGALLGFVLLRLVLKTFRLVLVLGGVGGIAYIALLHH